MKMSKPLLLVGALLPACAALFGQAGTPVKRPMTFADLMAIKRVSDPQISPSGKWVLFSVTNVSLETNTKVNHLWVVPLDAAPGSAAKERQLTFGAGESNGRFSPDGKSVSLTLGDQVGIAPWNEAAGTMGPPVASTHFAGGADGAIWSPDSARLLFVSQVYPECSDLPDWKQEDDCTGAKNQAAEDNPVKAQLFTHLLYRHWTNYTGNRRSHVLVMNADLSHVRDLTPKSAVGDAETPTFSLGGPLGYAWAPDSHEIAYVTNLDPVPAASTNNDIFTLRLDEPGAKAVKISTSPGSDDGPQYSPDGKWLAFRSQARAEYESDRFRLMLFDRKTKAMKEAIPSYEDLKREVVQDLWVDEFVWSPDSKGIAYASGYHGEEVVRTVGIDEAKLLRFGWQLTGAEYSDIHFLDNNTLVAVRMKVTEPSEVILAKDERSAEQGYDIISGSVAVKALTGINRAVLTSLSLDPLTSFYFKGAENTEVQGFLIRPPNFDPSHKYPLKFLIHGGPQGAWGDAWSYRWNAELMAASGYVVVMVNPRGSTGYGQAFIDGVNGDWGGKPYIDLMRGLDAAEKQFPFIDKDRECALGASYGGFMANWILTHPDPRRPDRFKCIVTHDGMYNPAAAYGDTEELWFNEWEFRRAGSDGKPDPEPAQPWRYAALPADQDPFRKWSPMLHIQDAKTPTLVIHSQRDYRLDVSEGFQLFTALQRLNVPSQMLYFPDEGHWIMKPRNSELWYKTVGDWCDKWTHTNAYATTPGKNP